MSDSSTNLNDNQFEQDILNTNQNYQDEQQELVEQLIMHSITSVMGNKQGRVFVWSLLSQCGMDRTSFSREQLVMAFNEGTRNVGLWLKSLIEAQCPELYFKMLTESKEYQDDYRPSTTDDRRYADATGIEYL